MVQFTTRDKKDIVTHSQTLGVNAVLCTSILIQNLLTSLQFASDRLARDKDCFFLDVADEGLPNYKIKLKNFKTFQVILLVENLIHIVI